MLAEKYPDVISIQNGENVGLGKASNQGIDATRGRYILLLNNDTIVNGESFDAMIEFLDRNPKIGAVGGKLLNPDGTIQTCYNYFSTLHGRIPSRHTVGRDNGDSGYPAVMRAAEVQSVDWLGSACLLLRRSALDRWVCWTRAILSMAMRQTCNTASKGPAGKFITSAGAYNPLWGAEHGSMAPAQDGLPGER